MPGNHFMSFCSLSLLLTFTSSTNGDHFTKDSYRRTVQRAAEKANVDSWTQYQLRYSVATEVREMLGVESAQALLEHSQATMTEHYAKLSEAKAPPPRCTHQGRRDHFSPALPPSSSFE